MAALCFLEIVSLAIARYCMGVAKSGCFCSIISGSKRIVYAATGLNSLSRGDDAASQTASQTRLVFSGHEQAESGRPAVGGGRQT